MKAKNTRYKKILVFSAFTLDFCVFGLFAGPITEIIVEICSIC